jgi:hypothetical protein
MENIGKGIEDFDCNPVRIEILLKKQRKPLRSLIAGGKGAASWLQLGKELPLLKHRWILITAYLFARRAPQNP